MTKRISQQTETKLMDVLSKVAEFTAAGDSPNDAIVKAGEGRLRPGEIELVVRAYNIGRTNCQREDSDSLFEKNATFELADSDVVTEKMFPSTVKTAAQHTMSTVVSSDYTQPGIAVARQLKWRKPLSLNGLKPRSCRSRHASSQTPRPICDRLLNSSEQHASTRTNEQPTEPPYRSLPVLWMRSAIISALPAHIHRRQLKLQPPYCMARSSQTPCLPQ